MSTLQKIVALSIIISAFNANAEIKLVPLDMDPGYWETTTEMGESDIIKNMIANMPEAQRAKMREMMKSKMKIPMVKQCITEESFKDMEKKMREGMGDNAKNCQFDTKKSTNKEFIGVLDCSHSKFTIHTKVINSKHNESSAVADMGAAGLNKIRTISKWKSTTCPADAK
jgi:hypothetical protein